MCNSNVIKVPCICVYPIILQIALTLEFLHKNTKPRSFRLKSHTLCSRTHPHTAPFSLEFMWPFHMCFKLLSFQTENSIRISHWEEGGREEHIPGNGSIAWSLLKHLFTINMQCLSNTIAITITRGFPGGAVVKNPPANVGYLGSISGWGDPLEEGMAAHSIILAWRIPWIEEPGRLLPIG